MLITLLNPPSREEEDFCFPLPKGVRLGEKGDESDEYQSSAVGMTLPRIKIS